MKEVELQFTPAATNVQRVVAKFECVLQQMHNAFKALASNEANDSVANSLTDPLKASCRLQNDVIYQREEENETCCARCSVLELQAVIGRWESHVSRCEKQLEDTLGDVVKLAGLYALVLEELEGAFDTQLETLASV